MDKKVIIVGAGPSGLFCSYLLLKKGYSVDLYDQSSGPAKKFLIAGKGGLNLSHSEDLNKFSTRYGKDSQIFKKLLYDFSAKDLVDWCSDLDVETFVGVSGRIFPKSFKAAEILSKWLDKLKSYKSFNLFLNHKLVGLTKEKLLTFEGPDEQKNIQAEFIIFALGGASWKKTGSDGEWKSILQSLNIKLHPFLPMNCGFEIDWSEYFKKNVDRHYLKNIEVSFQDHCVKGELMLTPYGIEGGAIYALSNHLRNALSNQKKVLIKIDLKPGLSLDSIVDKLKRRDKKTSLSNHIRKVFNFDKKLFILLKEVLDPSDFDKHDILAQKIKNLEIRILKTRPLDEAISTSGGVCFSELNDYFELKTIPGLYFAGEMLDFEAPTGGYLLQGCFSTSFRVVDGIFSLLNHP